MTLFEFLEHGTQARRREGNFRDTCARSPQRGGNVNRDGHCAEFMINRTDVKQFQPVTTVVSLSRNPNPVDAQFVCPQYPAANSIMNLDALYSELTLKTGAKLVLLVLDGLGDVATREQGYLTPLEAAATPNLDALAKDSAQGRMIPVAPGITPGSGPGHLALFGYDPLEFQVGRGVIEALGLGLELGH